MFESNTDELRSSETGNRLDRSRNGKGHPGETGFIPRWNPVSSSLGSGVCVGVLSAGNSKTPSTAESGTSSFDIDIIALDGGLGS